MKNKLIIRLLPKTLILGLILLPLLMLQNIASAATQDYLYVNQSGEVKLVEANSINEAFEKAVDIAPHSGVKLVEGSQDLAMVGDGVLIDSDGGEMFGVGGSEDNLYLYVKTNGEIGTVVADTPEEAIAIAPDRDPDSGVKRADVYTG